MTDGEYRHRSIPPITAISAEENRRFERFLGDKYLGDQLDQGVLAFVSSPGLSEDLNRYIAEVLPSAYEEKKEKTVKFLKDEIFSILAELKLLKDVSRISIFFDRRKYGGAGIEITGEVAFVSIDIVDLSLMIVKDKETEDLKAKFVDNLSHEFFHKYVANNYARTNEKSLSANSKNVDHQASPEYLRDRGENAANLFSAHHLDQRAKETQETDSELSVAFANKAKKVREELKTLTAEDEAEKIA